ncbi:NAD(P)/FAD-dependent oxidoreductase [Conexibacter arvalis]|uniref:NADPH-dependent 2,4-dienoyl-CoA reductase/sulfur reductase-like enzyme n=1 Tax=Conexibacter arvalis TaxID=912552 RepID=A0A840I9Y8_9ACTN|nr:FAD-dependent oxidoreductase [Conexibacter arvalis]MBB4661729.1 NADPH-dependent 2,4-dienoyl-CoA reductase/sulfur reductase-like enzyme [Conexibacter arvalis]
MSGRERIVVVGASLAGYHAARELRALGFDGEVTVVGAEPHRPYDRPPLSKELLAGRRTAAEIALALDDAPDVEWLLGTAATGLDLDRRVVLAGAREVAFDGLVIATGARPATLPGLPELAPGRPGVHALRSLDDAQRLRGDLRPGARLLIVGAGFVGVEVATVAAAAGCEVAIVTLDPPLAVAGPQASAVCRGLLEEAGVRLLSGRTVASVEERGGERVALLDDGAPVAFDAALVAIGARPAVDWLEGSGLVLEDGVVCDASLAAVGAVAVVAAGDVARWPNAATGGALTRVEHWGNAVEQGAAAARTLLEGPGPHTAHAAVPEVWSDHLGARLQTVGELRGAARFEVVAGAVEERRFAAAAYDAGERLVGAVAYDMPRELTRWREQLTEPVAAVGR